MTLPPKFDAELQDHLARHGTHRQLNADEILRADGFKPNHMPQYRRARETEAFMRRKRAQNLFMLIVVCALVSFGAASLVLGFYFGGKL